MRIALMAALLAGLAVPAHAQTRLPRTSPTERQLEDINRSLSDKQQQQRFEQQYQMDNNQLRQSIDRQKVFSNPTPPAGIRTCPPGSVGC